MKPYDALEPGRSHAFGVLLDAVLYETHNVTGLVKADPSILRATNWTGENVLRWLAVENLVDGIGLLRSLGSPIPPVALTEALELGHCETVILLLELGVEVDILSCRTGFLWGSHEMSRLKRRLMRSYFKQFGHDLDSELLAKPARLDYVPPSHRLKPLTRRTPRPIATRPNRRKLQRRAKNHERAAIRVESLVR
ncbi:MAG: hypothetical protein V4812_03915 [Pseudomonadota bacterium]